MVKDLRKEVVLSETEAPVEFLNQLIAMFNEGRTAEVETQAKILVEQFPFAGHAWQILGVAQQAQGKPAAQALERAVNLMPENAEAHYNLGVAQEDKGRLEEAEASFRQALVLNPWFPNAHCYLGHTQRKQGLFEEALDSYRATLAIDPTHYGANIFLQFSLMREGRFVEAEELCRRTLRFKSDFSEMRQLHAKSLAYMSNFTDVVQESDRALEASNDHPVTWEQRLYCFSYHPDLRDRKSVV